MKTYKKSGHIQTDTFLLEWTSPETLLQTVARSALIALNSEARPVKLSSTPNFTQAIKAARKQNRKTYTRRFMMRLIGLLIIVVAFMLVFTSCQTGPTPNVYESKAFTPASDSGNTHTISNESTSSGTYQTPIVGIFHPHSEDEVSGGNKGDEVYELASDTEVTEIKSSGSVFDQIDELIANGEQAKARRVISSTLLNKELTGAQQDSLMEKLRSINSLLLTSIDDDGDCKEITIEKGQTLYAIAKINKLSVEAIAALNNMNPNKYNAGQKIKVYKNQFHLIVKPDQNCVYLWQYDHIVERYKATINEVVSGMYKLKGKKKGSLGEMIYTGNLFMAPESTSLETSCSIKLSDQDYKVVNMLLVTNALLDIK